MASGIAKPLTFDQLPDAAVLHIIRFVLGIQNGVLVPDATTEAAIVTLARTSTKIRSATARVVKCINYGNASSPWPSLKVMAPYIWETCQKIDIKVNRQGMIGFLKWLLPANGLTHLRLVVEGEDYEQPRLIQLERMLLGRLFTQIGNGLETVSITGIGCQALFFGMLFQCTNLQSLHIARYRDTNVSTCLIAASLLCLVNRDTLQEADVSISEWLKEFEVEPSCIDFTTKCKATWDAVWNSYRTGLKESAANLPTDETEIVRKFNEVSARMEPLQKRMDDTLSQMQKVATDCKTVMQLLNRMLPNTTLIHGGDTKQIGNRLISNE